MVIHKKIEKNAINNTSYEEKKISINYDLQTLNLFCMYVVSENTSVRTSNLATMKKLIDRLDMSLYFNDVEKLKRIEFINRGLEARVVRKMKNHDVITHYINSGSEEQLISKIYELSTEEIEWVNETISESAKHAFMYDYVDQLMDLCTRFKQRAYNSRGEIVIEFESVIDGIKSQFRRVTSESMTEAEFSLAEGVFNEVMADIYARETNPSKILYTGMQGFNELCGGGLESGRVYLLFGLAAAGKSLTLLNIAYQIKKYNKLYQCKDKTKKPCIAILTMENSVQETVSRLFSIVAGDRMSNYSLDEVIRKLREDGELIMDDTSPIDIIIKYKPNASVDTNYLYTFYDDLSDRGYEMICLIQDHLKKIRPRYPKKDLRLDLGEIVNDFKAFAIDKGIPVLSDSHLNREGARIVDTAAASNKQDITKLLGRSNISESFLMQDNADCCMIINKDRDREGNLYMVFFRNKMRDMCSNLDYIAQPFEQGSTIRLVEDMGLDVPLYKESLAINPPVNKLGFANNDYYDAIKTINDDTEMSEMKNGNERLFDKPKDDGVMPANEISLKNLNLTPVGMPSVPIYNHGEELEGDIVATYNNVDGFFDEPQQQMVYAPLTSFDKVSLVSFT